MSLLKHTTPVTTNLFHFNCGIDCWKVSEILDVISFDKYPHWHNGADKTSEWAVGVESAFAYDYCRSMQNKPFLLMESSPSSTNWMPVAKLKRPGIHMLGSMQAIAGGADSVQYFQWRQSRGAFEKFHGAVVTHNGSEHTRVFQDVTQVGARLADLAHIKIRKPRRGLQSFSTGIT
ncbi:beta-galactosidase [Waltera sp. CLA-AA-H273]|uniref:Beta-galactosidase n=1 Tax=Waltera acetigignens TaxID=2981769 RepID=A0AAE3A152_9FIRM|nr:beta-galactosidase [Brotolimicola acetigignens]